jgi:uncharacterized membrane protein YidH (DUF202 family)
MTDPPRTKIFDKGMQAERTALAWERTAIASMVAGVLMARYAAVSSHFVFAGFGIAQVVLGAALLLWSAGHYDDLHGPLHAGLSPVHPTAARRVGLAAVLFTGAGLVLAIVIAAG